jgi:hypothetical protein
MFKVFDLFALGGNRDWSSEFFTLYKNIMAGADKSFKDFEASRVLNTKPSLPLDEYTGRYTDPLYGEVVITKDNDDLVIVANNYLKARVSHWHYDMFRGYFDKRWYGKLNVLFTMNTKGNISKVSFDGIQFSKSDSKGK